MCAMMDRKNDKGTPRAGVQRRLGRDVDKQREIFNSLARVGVWLSLGVVIVNIRGLDRVRVT